MDDFFLGQPGFDIGIPYRDGIRLNSVMWMPRLDQPLVTRSRFSSARGGIADVACLAQRVPLFPVERWLPLGDVAAARAASPARIGWAAIFVKAYALVATEMPVLRTWLVRGLMPYLATAPASVATIAVNRLDDGADRLLFARLPTPETRSLADIQQFITACGTKPLDEMFKRQLQFEKLPGPLRRTILRWNMNSSSMKRATRIGTFSLSTLASFGAINRFHPTLCTTSLSYGPLEADGRSLATLICDHRVIDGAAAARALTRLGDVLRGEMVAELQSLTAGVMAPTTDGHGAAA